VIDQRGRLLVAALGFAGFFLPSYDLALRTPPLARHRKGSAADPEVLALFDSDPRTRTIHTIVKGVADTDNPVLIRGERAVDQDLVARAIHAMPPRRDGPRTHRSNWLPGLGSNQRLPD
jgi:hypothetical protein